MTLFKKGKVQIKEENATFNGQPIFEIFELLKNDIGSATTWHFWGRLAASSKRAAYSRYLTQKSQTIKEENEENHLFSGDV